MFLEIFKYIPDCSRTCRVQKKHNILRKNTIFNEHPVLQLKAIRVIAGYTYNVACLEQLAVMNLSTDKKTVHKNKVGKKYRNSKIRERKGTVNGVKKIIYNLKYESLGWRNWFEDNWTRFRIHNWKYILLQYSLRATTYTLS